MNIRSFTQLLVWQKSHKLALEVYRVTRLFPAIERFVLVPQMRRAAISIPSNIAEGFGRRRPADKARHYTIAMGSAEELKAQLLIGRDLQYIGEIAPLWSLAEEVCKMLRRLEEHSLGEASEC